jgi:putative ABC transport system substrate-binding protein
MRRREFITALGGSAAALPFWGGCALGNAVPSIGLLDPGLPELFAAFLEGMRELGYIEGQNVSYIRFSAEGRPEKVPQLASELIARNPDVIVTAGPLPVHAVGERTSTIPLVFAALGDALGTGVVSNLRQRDRIFFPEYRNKPEAPGTVARHASRFAAGRFARRCG